MTDHTIPRDPAEVRKFGLLFGSICVLISGYLIYKGHGTWPAAAAGALFFFATGQWFQKVLSPIHYGWMKFAFVLGWINTRILLGVFFYLILTPIGLIMRLLGKDQLTERFDRSAASYWVKRLPVPFEQKRYEQLF